MSDGIACAIVEGMSPDAALAAASILVVDDDPVAIQLVRAALRGCPDVRFATNGHDALRVTRERPPDLILLDGEMPEEDGFQVCATLKADPGLADIPVIFVTAHDDLAFEVRALELGAADFIPKPISGPRVELRVKLHLELKHQLDRLRALATTDALTGLHNRRAFDDTLAREWLRAQRTGAPLSLIMVDVDFFKRYNDTYGHPAGDACLQAVARVLDGCARRVTDFAGRLGGEEFGLLLACTPPAGACRVAQRLGEAVAGAALPHRTSDVAPHVTLSIGVACSGDLRWSSDGGEPVGPPPSAGTLLGAADRALYRAKQRGRNRVEYLDLASAEDGDVAS